jgi:class 3 adenylate cyclase/tetratricopeptide (TPR) repeat protein
VLTCERCGHESSDGARFCEACGLSLRPEPVTASEQRRTVTVLFCDLAGSTALGERVDPERLRAMMARYFERMRAIVERYGGSVEKFIGDAVMAVFGVPALHEDDAERAVRAAMEMREALPELGLEGRIGIMTGEVVTGTEERLATGDAVNVAARLEQAASPGEVLIGEPTLALVGPMVETEPVAPLELKGKSRPVPAHRLLRVRDRPPRPHVTRFVGRERDLAMLRDGWDQAVAERRCALVTIVGDAGVGKSRLASELLSTIDSAVVQGRCLPYGEGITYRPVVEVLRQLDVEASDEAAAEAMRSLLGQSSTTTSADEIAWGFRKTLERAARRRPLVVLFDDIQWGEETFLDLIDHVALLTAEVPILLLCLARPELAERRPAWPLTVRLGPLDDSDIDSLIPAGVSSELRAAITRQSGGNPLFVEEMIAMAREADERPVIAPTLQALLAARLGALDPAERRVLESAAIEGEVFHRGAVQALSPDGAHVTRCLAGLVRQDLLRPAQPQLPNEDGFRFRHILIRDAAYDGLSKAARADLHAGYARWLADAGAALVELDEIVGYHLEQAYGYRVELGLPEEPELAAAAAAHLAAAGRRAQLRADYGAVVSLLDRAAALLPPGSIDLAVETGIGDALHWSGQGEEALGRARSLTERATASGDRVAVLCGRIKEQLYLTSFEPEGAAEQVLIVVEEALPVFEAAADDVALYTAYHARGWALFTRGRPDPAVADFERAVTHGRQAGLPDDLLGWRAVFRLYGSTPLSELLTWLDDHETAARRDHWLRAARAYALAMLGHFEQARALLVATRSDLADRGGGLELATITGIESAHVELLAGDPESAAELSAEGCRQLEELGELGFLSSAAATLAESLCQLGRLDEADSWAERGAELGASDDLFTQMQSQRVRANVLARRGALADAEALAHEAVATAASTDDIDAQGSAYADLAEVLVLRDSPDDAAAALSEAAELFGRKGNVVAFERVRARLAELPARA